MADENRAPGRGNGENFQQHKEKMLARMEQRKVKIQSGYDCLKAATTPEDAKACRSNEDHGGRDKRRQ